MQDYAGGGLSVFTGFSAFAASTSKSKYLMSKFDDKVLSYGIQANVADFAYAKSKDDYLQKKLLLCSYKSFFTSFKMPWNHLFTSSLFPWFRAQIHAL